MRFPLAPLAALPLLLAACASDPRPLDAAATGDAGGAPDLGGGDGGADAGALDVPAADHGAPLDAGADVAPPPLDAPAAMDGPGALEAGADVVDAPDVVRPLEDAGPADAPDVRDVATVDVVDAGAPPVDTGGADAPDAPDAATFDVVDASHDRPDVPACTAGFANCDGSSANGCETDTRTSTTHCGLCGNGCAPGQTCNNGFCSIPPCSAGFGNCDGLAPNGCETDTRTSAAHCGMCGRACSSGQLCAAGACVDPPCANDAVRCNAGGGGVERCVAGAWTLIRTCTTSGLPSGSSAGCYQGGCAYCLGVDGGPSCGEATCRDDEDCYRVREGRCVDGRCSRRGILPCVDDSACLPWAVSGVGSACTFTATDLNGASVRSCTGSLVAPCTTDAMCPRAHRCELRSGTCRPT